ncbi:MAG: ABC-2 transporter permease, partial [Oscillospiraceae bacterium]|nr:ABC-2 transporter permease [Oscillospiraceae bacterium]
MTGLILKDFMILRRSIRSFLLVAAIYAVLSFSGFWDASLFGGMIMVLACMLPMNVFAYDQQAKWDIYGLALPVGRTKTVAARYAAVVLLCLASLAISAAGGIVMFAVGRLENPLSYLASCSVLGFIAVLVNAVLLPLLYKFGPERARFMLYGVLGVMVLAFMVFLFPLGGLEWLKTLGEPTPAQIAALPFIAAIVGVVLLALS